MGKADSATRTDGASVLGEDNPGVRRVGQDRMAAMEALGGKRREDIAAEAGVDIPAPPPDKPDPDAEQIDDRVIDPADPDGTKAAAAKAAKEKADADAQRQDTRTNAVEDQLRRQMAADGRVVLEGNLANYFVRSKVDGVEQEMSLEHVHRAMQKDFAADRRLEEASKVLKEAEAERARAKAEGDAAAIRRADKAVTDAEGDLEGIKTDIQAAAEALFAGDTAAATELLTKVVSAGRGNATPDVDALAAAVTARVEQQTALRTFQKDYSEIPTNPHLTAMCDAKVAELVKSGKSFEEALPLAGDHVRAEIKKLAGDLGMSDAGTTTSTGRRVDRSSRKAELDEPTRAKSAAQASNPQEQGSPSPSTVIDEMRAKRIGGQVPRPPA
jgi:hypothetical protein